MFLQETFNYALGAKQRIARSVVFLCSDEASYITGTTLRADGGTRPTGCYSNRGSKRVQLGSLGSRPATSGLGWLLPECERGAMPTLGPLFHQRVFVDRLLAEEEEIVFNGGTHADAVVMRYDDFASLTEPRIGRFAIRGS